MNKDCNIARDLMPLCVDGAASAESARLVEDHIRECGECRAYFDAMVEAMPSGKADPGAAERTDFGLAAQAARRSRRRRILRRALLMALLGVVIITMDYLGWRALMVETNAEYPVSRYDVSLARLADGRAVLWVNLRGSTRVLGIASGSDGKTMNVLVRTTVIPVRRSEPSSGHPIAVFRDLEASLDEITAGGGGQKTVWRDGDAIPAASPEMEAYYAALEALDRASAEFAHSIGQNDLGEEQWEAYSAAQKTVNRLFEAVPEWQ